MTVDPLCDREMTQAASCVNYKIQYADGEVRDPVPYGEETGEHRTAEGRCHDCGVEPGGIHHPGCDWAECPRCGDQLLKHELAHTAHDLGIDPPVIRAVVPTERYYDVREGVLVEIDDE